MLKTQICVTRPQCVKVTVLYRWVIRKEIASPTTLPLAHFQHCELLDDVVKQLYLTCKRSINKHTSREITLQLVIGAPSLFKQNETLLGTYRSVACKCRPLITLQLGNTSYGVLEYDAMHSDRIPCRRRQHIPPTHR